MLSIRFDSNESTRIVPLAVDSLYRKSICEILRKYSILGLYRVGWNCCRFDSIRSNRHESFPLLSICYTGSRFARVLENDSFPGLYRVGWKCCRFDSIRTNRHESFSLLSIRYTGSRFERYFENIASWVYTGWVENVVDSTRSERIDTNRFPCCRFVLPEVDLQES